MARAYGYLAVAGAVWLVEGLLFSYFLRFALWQLVLMAVLYIGLYVCAMRLALRNVDPSVAGPGDVSAWRYVALAPMLAVIVGSFASLPLLLGIVFLGKLV